MLLRQKYSSCMALVLCSSTWLVFSLLPFRLDMASLSDMLQGLGPHPWGGGSHSTNSVYVVILECDHLEGPFEMAYWASMVIINYGLDHFHWTGFQKYTILRCLLNILSGSSPNYGDFINPSKVPDSDHNGWGHLHCLLNILSGSWQW